MGNIKTFLLACLSVSFCVLSRSQDDHGGHVVVTKNGNVRGKQFRTLGKNLTYTAYRGIPYAEPPVGKLRFKAPEPAKKWGGVLDATKDKSECVQGLLVSQGSEDCLYINVYVPEVTPRGGKKPLSVMVWIHGGTFLTGSSSYDENGPDYLLDNGVIFVSFNYRLGIFGFLSTGDLEAPGNAGLKDMILALRWVSDNIASFGGDPHDVTIFGQSAGAASVSYLVMSHQAKGLFKGAIMESATALCIWSLSRRAKEYAENVARLLHVNHTDTRELVKGLQAIPYDRLQSVASRNADIMLITGIPTNGLIIAPVKEPEHPGAVFTKRSYEVIKSGDFDRVPTIIGFNSMEANSEVFSLLRLYFARYDLDVSELVPIDMNISNQTIKTDVGRQIKFHYSGIGPFGLNAVAIIKYLTDDQFIRPIIESVRLSRKYKPLFLYKFTYEGCLGAATVKPVSGVGHVEELGCIFTGSSRPKPSAKAESVRLQVTRMWTNFAKYGNPTPESDPLLGNVKWLESKYNTTGDDIWALNIGDNLANELNPNKEAVVWWRQLYQTYGNPPYDTY